MPGRYQSQHPSSLRLVGDRWPQDQYAFHTLGLYPVNTLRNEAVLKARTAHLLVLDADFIPSKNARRDIMCVTLPYCSLSVMWRGVLTVAHQAILATAA